MLGFFPTPYPDELLYSLIARYHIRSGNISPKITLRELFGSTKNIATADLPANLNILSTHLQHLIPYIDTNLIPKYTLYPFYQPFLTSKRDRLIQKSMKAQTDKNVHTRIGVMASAIAMPKYFRFCPQCNTEDLNQYGEMYWHRLHQITGVLVCPKHSIFLQDSSVSFQGENRHEYYAANSDRCLSIDQINNFTDRTRKQLQILSTDIWWLLNQNLTAHSPEYFQQQYRSLLIDREYANCNGRVYRDRLEQDFRSFYSPKMLVLLDSSLDRAVHSNWLFEISCKHHKSFHPIRHLLLIRFLTGSIDKFFSTKYQYHPFGKKPWPCLNPAAPHHLKKVITDLKISHCLENKQPLGTFFCSCGMIYCRTGPDQTEEDLYKIGKIIEFGEMWQQKLKELVEVNKLGLRAIARELKVDARTVKRYVSHLKLESHWQKRSVDSIKSVTTKSTQRSPDLEQRQKQWISLQQQYPNATKTQLRKLSPATYIWLYRHAHDWLQANSPERQQFTSVNNRVNWPQRDLDVCDLVKIAVGKIINEEKPQRLTSSRIGKMIGLSALLEQHLDLMPVTKDYLSSVTESIEDFQIRRIKWAAAELERRGKPLAVWRVMRLAGLRGNNCSDRVKKMLESFVVGRY
jgi:hypothetical protein